MWKILRPYLNSCKPFSPPSSPPSLQHSALAEREPFRPLPDPPAWEERGRQKALLLLLNVFSLWWMSTVENRWMCSNLVMTVYCQNSILPVTFFFVGEFFQCNWNGDVLSIKKQNVFYSRDKCVLLKFYECVLTSWWFSLFFWLDTCLLYFECRHHLDDTMLLSVRKSMREGKLTVCCVPKQGKYANAHEKKTAKAQEIRYRRSHWLYLSWVASIFFLILW